MNTGNIYCLGRSPSEPAADHTARKVPRQTRPIHGVRRKAGCLAEFVASREGERIRDGENEGDDYVDN